MVAFFVYFLTSNITVPFQGPLLYVFLPMDTIVDDQLIEDINITLHNNPVLRSGKTSNGLYLNGDNQYADLGKYG